MNGTLLYLLICLFRAIFKKQIHREDEMAQQVKVLAVSPGNQCEFPTPSPSWSLDLWHVCARCIQINERHTIFKKWTPQCFQETSKSCILDQIYFLMFDTLRLGSGLLGYISRLPVLGRSSPSWVVTSQAGFCHPSISAPEESCLWATTSRKASTFEWSSGQGCPPDPHLFMLTVFFLKP